MRYVLDSSVAFKWVVDEALADQARRVREDFRNAIHELLAPDVFPPELAHALTKGERQGRLVDAEGLWADVMSTAPNRRVVSGRSSDHPFTLEARNETEDRGRDTVPRPPSP